MDAVADELDLTQPEKDFEAAKANFEEAERMLEEANSRLADETQLRENLPNLPDEASADFKELVKNIK